LRQGRLRTAGRARACGGAGRGAHQGRADRAGQDIPLKFLENILLELRHDGLVASQRGAEGGYWLARPPEEITLAEVIRAVDGPLANVRGARPETVDYNGPAERLKDVGSPCART
jgi:Rrf2 family protein